MVEIRGFEPRGRGFDSRPGYFFAPLIRSSKTRRRESQMARRPAATRNKWVRLPLASLYRHPSLQGSALQRTELVALPHTLVAHACNESTDALARVELVFADRPLNFPILF